MLIYLDNCVFNRPFDNHSHLRVRLEAEAKLYIQSQIKQNNVDLIWSYILELENSQNPFLERRYAVSQWRNLSKIHIVESVALLEIARKLLSKGIKPKDSLHVASAIMGKASYFLSTDDKLLNKLINYSDINALNPIEFIGVIDEYNRY